ncbi:MAG TPA: PASTA domain-containing protein [Candidatus Hydrogenedentes bacterium]|nr:PASTA domain-containing protein [Candidatus Hydrogenedentota bacterium]
MQIFGLLLLICVATAGGTESSITYVNAGANNKSATGFDWAHAFQDLQQALDHAALNGKYEVWIKTGVYYPDKGGKDRAQSFILPDKVKLYGGFEGTETSLEQRNPKVCQVILSGDLNKDDNKGNFADNSCHLVKVMNNHNSRNLLDGLMFYGGRATDETTGQSGAGLYIDNATVTVANCWFHNNFANDSGGAVFVKGGESQTNEIRFQNCTFTSNESLLPGAALGICQNHEGAPYPSLFLEDCLFQSNMHQYTVSASGTVLSLRNSRFLDNHNGALAADNDTVLTAENCLFMRNEGTDSVIALGKDCTADFQHCTMAENDLVPISIAPDTDNTTYLMVANSIVWDDTLPSIEIDPQNNTKADVQVKCTLIRGNYPGEGNREEHPGFRQADPPGQLNWDSPAIDLCGESTSKEDIDKEPRPQGTAFDAGAYEFGKDSDGGGLPDWYERRYEFLPDSINDDTEDTDGDGLNNLEEFRRGLDPRSPVATYYVDKKGSDTEGDGSSAQPWQTIGFALSHMPEAFAEIPMILYVGEGTYNEQVIFRPATHIIGAGIGKTFLQYFDTEEKEHFVVQAAPKTALSNCTVTLPQPVSVNITLIRVTDVDIKISNCEVDGLNSPYSCGIAITGPGSSPSDIRYTTIRRVQVGIHATDTGVNITRNLFEDILECAISINTSEEKQGGAVPVPMLGSKERMDETGFNQFRMTTGLIIDNQTEVKIQAENNDWGVYTEQEITDRILPGQSNIDFDSFIRKALVRGTITIKLLEASSRKPLPANTFPSVMLNSMSGLFDPQANLFLFTDLEADNYFCKVGAEGYRTETQLIPLADGEICHTTIAMTMKIVKDEFAIRSVPDLSTLTREQAEAILGENNLVLGMVSEQHDPSLPAGQVISQSPLAGAKVDPGAMVAITLSTRTKVADPVLVPFLMGLDDAIAVFTLSNIGLVLGSISKEYHSDFSEGQIVSQTPVSWVEVEQNTAVSISVSLGFLPIEEVAARLYRYLSEVLTDNNNGLDLENASRCVYMTQEQFNRLDEDGNGFITQEELHSFLTPCKCGCGSCCCSYEDNTTDYKVKDFLTTLDHCLLMGLASIVLLIYSRR